MSQFNVYLPLSAVLYGIASFFAYMIGIALSKEYGPCMSKHMDLIFFTITIFVASFGIYNFGINKMKTDQRF